MDHQSNNEFSEHENNQDYYKSQRVNQNAVMLYNVDDKIKKKKKVVREDYNDTNQYQNDLVEQLERGNKKRIKFVYGDGKQRPFGQTLAIPEYGEKSIHVGLKKQFIYEGGRDEVPYNAPKKKLDFYLNKARFVKPRGEDTRSLYDDPKLQRLRQTCTRKLIQKLDGDIQTEQVQGCQWDPIQPNDKIPECYYMKTNYSQIAGPQNLDPNKVYDEYETFKLFFCDQVYARIIKYTKEKYDLYFIDKVYAYCHGLTKVKPHYFDFQLHERELDAFFSVHLFFGIVRLSNMRDYFKHSKKSVNKDDKQFKFLRMWKRLDETQTAEDKYSYYVQQKMAQILSYTRFKEIKKFMGLSGIDSKEKHPNDTLYRIRDFITDQNDKYKKFYYPDEYLCVDEGMIPFGGKAKFKVYNPDKPTQWGIKEYLLCDAVKSYTLHIQIYHGHSTWDMELKSKMLLEEDADLSSRTLELVLSLLKPYEGKGHKVVMDNYYTSWQLMSELKNRGIGALGTIRHNRTGLKKQDFVSDHFQQIYQGDGMYKKYAFYLNSTNDCVLLYFQGTADKEVAMITNYLDHSQNEDHKFAFSKKHYYVPNYKFPYIISTYNKYKGGVDRRNAYMVNFRSKFSVRKWWQSIFERFFETAVYNSFCIYKHMKRTNILIKRGRYRDFRVTLMQLLSERYKEYQQRVDEGSEKDKQSRFSQPNPHTFLIGGVQIICQECGLKTKNFCQECTMLQGSLVGVCIENEQKNIIKCARFHSFKQFIKDKNKIVIDKKFLYTSYDPQSLLNFYTEVGEIHKSRHLLKEERTNLITENNSKKVTAENLTQIVSLLKSVKTTKKQNYEDTSTTQEELKKLIKEQLSLLKGQKSEMNSQGKIEINEDSDDQDNSEGSQKDKIHKNSQVKVKLETVQHQSQKVIRRMRESKDNQCISIITSESEETNEDEDPQMLESDAEAKALVEEAEQSDSGGEEEEVDYEDRETNQYKKFQLDYERNRSLHIDSNKQKKKQKIMTKQHQKSNKNNMNTADNKKKTNNSSNVVDEFHQQILQKKQQEFPFNQDLEEDDMESEYPSYRR